MDHAIFQDMIQVFKQELNYFCNPLSGDRSSLHTATNVPRDLTKACSLVTCGKAQHSTHKAKVVGHTNKPCVYASGMELGRRARVSLHTEDGCVSLEIVRDAAFRQPVTMESLVTAR